MNYRNITILLSIPLFIHCTDEVSREKIMNQVSEVENRKSKLEEETAAIGSKRYKAAQLLVFYDNNMFRLYQEAAYNSNRKKPDHITFNNFIVDLCKLFDCGKDVRPLIDEGFRGSDPNSDMRYLCLRFVAQKLFGHHLEIKHKQLIQGLEAANKELTNLRASLNRKDSAS